MGFGKLKFETFFEKEMIPPSLTLFVRFRRYEAIIEFTCFKKSSFVIIIGTFQNEWKKTLTRLLHHSQKI